MRHEKKFFISLKDTELFIEEMLCSGADIFAIEELLFGNPQMPNNLPYCFNLKTSFDYWKKTYYLSNI